MSGSDPPAGNRAPIEQRECDACGRVATCVLPPKGGGQVGAPSTACLARTLGGIRESPNW